MMTLWVYLTIHFLWDAFINHSVSVLWLTTSVALLKNVDDSRALPTLWRIDWIRARVYHLVPGICVISQFLRKTSSEEIASRLHARLSYAVDETDVGRR